MGIFFDTVSVNFVIIELGRLDAKPGNGPGIGQVGPHALGGPHYHAAGIRIGFAQHNAYFWHGGCGIDIHDLAHVPDQTLGLLGFSRDHRRRIHQVDQGNVIRIKGLQKAVIFIARVYLQDTSGRLGIIRHNADNVTVKSGKTGDQVLGVRVFDFKVVTVVDQLFNNRVHIIGLIVFIGDDIDQIVYPALGVVGIFQCRRGFPEILGQVAQQPAALPDSFIIVVSHNIAASAELHVVVGTPYVAVDYFRSCGLGLTRAAKPHIGGYTAHEKKVAQGRQVSAAGDARAHEYGYLGDDPGIQGLQTEIPVEARHGDIFVAEPAAGGIQEVDHGNSPLGRHLKGLCKLDDVLGADGPAEHGEVTGVDHD